MPSEDPGRDRQDEEHPPGSPGSRPGRVPGPGSRPEGSALLILAGAPVGHVPALRPSASVFHRNAFRVEHSHVSYGRPHSVQCLGFMRLLFR